MSAVRCAIYTRKSSEEGLDQAFNSLDAQREACEAYVASQKGEGWKALSAKYDDGGFSGGSMERPALKRLLADIATGKVDIVVVYKIDRLTRSLTDFARIVETFDARQVSFVSVTQAFNTTTSMGRLTLNVLLSFAQFEREVTGERIRDKLAASKAKGMWMGGNLPLGYDAPTDPATRALVVNPEEADRVRLIFQRYLELGSLTALRDALAASQIRSKSCLTRDGKKRGDLPFTNGGLLYLLQNKIYRGIIAHRGKEHVGAHQPIVETELFEAVQQSLSTSAERRRARRARPMRSPLNGRIFEGGGVPMRHASARGKRGVVYRYYVAARPSVADGGVGKRWRRVSGPIIEAQVDRLLERLLPDLDDVARRKTLVRLEIHEKHIEVLFPIALLVSIKTRIAADETIARDHQSSSYARFASPVHIRRRGGRTWIDRGQQAGRTVRRNPTLIGALRKAHSLLGYRDGRPHLDAAPTSPHFRKLICLALLAPDLQAMILAGQQPSGLSVERLHQIAREPDWEKQRQQFAA